jgi:hypothetical protein
MSDESKTASETKRTRTRSPAYPAIDLQTALARASALWAKINRHATPLDTVASYWGYESKSSKAMSEVAAMIKYGLLSDDGIGAKRTIKLTDVGIKLSYNPDATSREYLNDLKKAALSPIIHRDLWDRYQGNLPDDGLIKRHLVVDKKFNEQYVDEFISQFRRTIEFSKLSPNDIVEQPGNESDSQPISMTQGVQESGPRTPQSAPRPPHFYGGGSALPSAPSTDDLSLPLESGKMVRIPKMSEDDYALLLETLQLWKRRIIIKPQSPGASEPQQT